MRNIDKDKLDHFLAGTFLAFLTCVIVVVLDLQLALIPFVGAFASCLVEVIQKEFNVGFPECLDAVWSLVPFVLFYIILVVK